MKLQATITAVSKICMINKLSDTQLHRMTQLEHSIFEWRGLATMNAWKEPKASIGGWEEGV